MKILLALLLLSTPTWAQYSHRANPGEIGLPTSGISALGLANGVCVDTGGSDTVLVSIGGTWTATLQFMGLNDASTQKALFVYGLASTGAITPPVSSTTANGDFVVEVSPFKRFCVVATGFTSNTSMTVRLDADPAPFFMTTVDVPSAGFQNDNVTTVVAIKATAGVLYQMSASNTTAATAYVQVFCLPSGSVTLGTTPPNYVIRLKTNAGAGDERDIVFPRGLCNNGTGLSVAATTTATGNTTAACGVSAAFL